MGGVGVYGSPYGLAQAEEHVNSTTPLDLFTEAVMQALQDMLKNILTVNDRLADEPETEDDDA